MTDELEFRLRRLQLHAPSADLDGRIAKVLHRAPLVGAPISASSWSTWAVTSTVLLLVGFGLGWAVASSLQTSPTNSLAPTVDRRPPALASPLRRSLECSADLSSRPRRRLAPTACRSATRVFRRARAHAGWALRRVLHSYRLIRSSGRCPPWHRHRNSTVLCGCRRSLKRRPTHPCERGRS